MTLTLLLLSSLVLVVVGSSVSIKLSTEEEEELPLVCISPVKGNGTELIFNKDTTRWIVPGFLSSDDSMIATQICCYQVYSGGEIKGTRMDLSAYTPINYIGQHYLQSSFLFVYNGDDREHIYQLDFSNRCATNPSITLVADLTKFDLSPGEVIETLVADPIISDNPMEINFFLSQRNLHLNISKTYQSVQLPTSLTSPNQNHSFTGAFYIGYNEESFDYIYLGRGNAGSLVDPAEIIVFETNDDLSYVKYLSTIPLYSSPINFLRPAHGTYVGQSNCEFYAHQLLQSFSYHLGNLCEGGYNYAARGLYEFSYLERIDFWPTANVSVLLLTGTSNSYEFELGFEIFLYLPFLNSTRVFNITEPYPDLVFVTSSDPFGVPLELSIFSHEPTTNYAVYFTVNLTQYDSDAVGTQNTVDFELKSDDSPNNGTDALCPGSQCCAGTSCPQCPSGQSCCQSINTDGSPVCNVCYPNPSIPDPETLARLPRGAPIPSNSPLPNCALAQSNRRR